MTPNSKCRLQKANGCGLRGSVVRPSSGAATLESQLARRSGDTTQQSGVAAPEDGRSPRLSQQAPENRIFGSGFSGRQPPRVERWRTMFFCVLVLPHTLPALAASGDTAEGIEFFEQKIR